MFTLRILPDHLVICRIASDHPVPEVLGQLNFPEACKLPGKDWVIK